MFGKIRDKLKNMFQKTEEIIEEVPETIEERVEEIKKKPKKEFKKKDKEENREVEAIQEEMLKEVPKEEKEAIKKHKDLPEVVEEKNKGKLEEQIEKEEELEKETLEEKPKKKGFFSKVASSLTKKKISEEDFDRVWIELEIFLLEINVAFEIVQKIEDSLRRELLGNTFDRFGLAKKVRQVLTQEVEYVLKDREASFNELVREYKTKNEPLKILILGVNGTGKTTSIAKIIHFLKVNNYSVVVAASDTFRAAAVEQLDEHCQRLGVKCIKHTKGSDPAAVAFDAVEHAKARNIDVVLIDTAGRMPNNPNLMMELQKVKRVSKADMAIFIGDSISGNDLIEQINLFDKGVKIEGVILTKVDTDERPGSIVTTAYSIAKPIFFLGVGQKYDDLVEFNAKEIAEKLFSTED